MNKDTKDIKKNKRFGRSVDSFDRTILTALTQDARMTFAEIGEICGLSSPAVYERVKRMKATGVLKGTTTSIDGASIGKPFLAFVHVDADGWGKSKRMLEISKFPEVEEMHSVSGDTSVILKVRTTDAQAMESFLLQLYILPGVRATKSFVVFSTYIERPVQPNITDAWPDIPLLPDA